MFYICVWADFLCGLHLRNGLRTYEKSFEVYVWL